MLKDFQSLATAIAAVNANASDTGVTMASYTPSNQPRACPAVQADIWLSSDNLPPTPNATLCNLMVASSSCVPSDAVASDATKIGSMFSTVCGLDATACKGIASNATTGTYGEFSMCNATQQLANALNTYYTNQKKASTACDFSGQAKVVTPTVSAGSIGSGSSTSSGSSSSVSSISSNNTSSTSTSSTSSVVSLPTSSTSASNSNSNSNTNNDNSTTASASNDGSANSNTTTQSSSKSGSGSSSGAGHITAVENAGWAGSLLIAVGMVALGL